MSVVRQFEAVRRNAGIWTRDTHTIVQFTGRDAGSWLQSQTTNDLLCLGSGEGCDNAMLDRQGRLLAYFSTHRWEDEYWLLVEKARLPAVLERLETHLFLEDVRVEDVGGGAPQILVEGPRALVFLARLLSPENPIDAGAQFPRARHAFSAVRLIDHEVLVFRSGETGGEGFVLVPVPGEAGALHAALLEHGREMLLTEVEAAAQQALRFEGGLGRIGLDYDAGVVISETPLEAVAVSYDKGCFLGQEVVQRLKSYGTPKLALRGLLVEDERAVLPEPGAGLYFEGRRIGQIRGSLWAPWRSAWLAHAYLDRDHRTPHRVLELHGEGAKQTFRAVVATLPFFTGPDRETLARAWYEEALRHFEADAQDEDDTAIELLKEVLILEPSFEDAWEVLGVILHRHHRVDEAIGVMQRLEGLNPASVMVHTNLSVFYVAKGMIQEAEAEKAKAEHLERKHQLDAQAATAAAAAERGRIQQEARERIGMFGEVLEIDPEDPVALMGLGKSWMQLEAYEEALPHFAAAAGTRKDYSAAFLEWGKCLEFLGRHAEAVEVYGRGIEAAGRKGDLMPLREMERRMKSLRGVMND